MNFYINAAPTPTENLGAKRPEGKRPGAKRLGEGKARGGNVFGAKRPGTPLLTA